MSADDAVDAILAAGDHSGAHDCNVTCSECGTVFYRSSPGRWNTCSDRCQSAWNMAIFDLDGGRTIVKLSELTAERAADLLGSAGFSVASRGQVTKS